MWGYLQEFWNKISGVALEAWEFTSEWFENVGNAVAGAIGGLFDWLLHFLNDTFVFGSWLVDGFKNIFNLFLMPFNSIFIFLKSFWQNVIKPPVAIESELENISNNAITIFSTIPYWNVIIYVLGLGIIVICAIGIIHLFMKF